MYRDENIRSPLEDILKKENNELLIQLKEMAINVEITKRKEFESQLLLQAQHITDQQKRTIIYEILVSLHTLWNQFQPIQGLQEKFRIALKSENFKEAEECYNKLAKQGLDYSQTVETIRGNVIPLISEQQQLLVHFDKNELTFFSPQVEPIKSFTISQSWRILDVLTPSIHQAHECQHEDISTVQEHTIMLLLANSESHKALLSIDINDLQANENGLQIPEDRIINLNESLHDVIMLSCFQHYLLLVSKNTVYYLKEPGIWTVWYRTANQINDFTSTLDTFWVGLDNGEVIILKKPGFEGVRDVFKGFSEPITHLIRSGRYILITGDTILRISDHGGNPASKPICTQCKIIQAAILNDEFLLLHFANGMLTASDLRQNNLIWQLNLGDLYNRILNLKNCLYFINKENTMVFHVPYYHIMAKELGSQNIYVENLSFERAPNAPIRYISDFIGRRNLLDEIKEKYNNHFLLYGEPLVGKTSLLNVLRDTLADRAKCCIIDMTQLLKVVDSFEAFEKNFITQCLAQHFMTISDFPNKNKYHYQILRAMIGKIKDDRKFCVFCIDNFTVQTNFNMKDNEKFSSFLSSIFAHTQAQVVMTCNSAIKTTVLSHLDRLKDSSKFKKIIPKEISLFSEDEVKSSIRKNISLQQSIIDYIYKHTGRFPHLTHYFNQWKPGINTIAQHAEISAQKYCEQIFDYFRHLSPDARIFITTCFHKKLIGKKLSYRTFYEKIPFLKTSLDKSQMEIILKEIADYGRGFFVQMDKDSFKISVDDEAQLFQLAAKHLHWFKNFNQLFEYSSIPGQESAHHAAQVFINITQSEMEPFEFLAQKIVKHNDKFYINKLTEKGMQTLKMPLSTFIVIPLQKWKKELYAEAFFDLYLEFKEFNRKTEENSTENSGPLFYIILFDLLGSSFENIKEDINGIDRISIINTLMMKDIILANSPQDKASHYIFNQLSIRERSPYTTAGAVPDSLFFGRQMEINLIRGLPENIGIFGTRTIGKTSLLRKLHKYFQSQNQWKVFDLDCARIESEEALLRNLAEKMGITFEQIPDLGNFRKFVTREAEAGGFRYLFLLDEVDRLVQFDIENDEKIFNTFNRLCNETMKNNETAARFILFGFHQMFEQMKNPGSRLYNFMVFFPLQALDQEGAMSLVTRPIENIRVKWKSIKDAQYLVDSCSRHPRLLQTACHALLTHLDSKGDRRDIIEQKDVDTALNSQNFREICMRYYPDQINTKFDSKISNDLPKKEMKTNFFSRFHKKESKDTNEEKKEILPKPNKHKEFLNDIHCLTILSAVRLLFEDKKEYFTITDFQKELKQCGIDASPNILRNILDQLCLNGNFRLRDESTIITRHSITIPKVPDKDKSEGSSPAITIQNPEEYLGNSTSFPKFTFEFGIRIFPKLLLAYLGGLEQCKEERLKLFKKWDWEEWLRRF